jgi:hypothetical protein
MVPNGTSPNEIRMWVVIMRQQQIRVSTMDNIPGERRPITLSGVVWGEGDSVSEAYESLVQSALGGGFEAIVGFRLIAVPLVGGGTANMGTGPIGTEVKWIAYGTMVSYQ